MRTASPPPQPTTTVPFAAELAAAGVRGEAGEQLVQRFALGLVAAGLPLLRAYVTVQSLHPLLRARAFVWERGGEAVASSIDRTAFEGWTASPLYPLYLSDESLLRYRLERGEGLDRFPLLREQRAGGATEYLVLKTAFADRGAGEGIMSAWTTDRPGGFDDAQVTQLRDALPILELGVKATSLSWTAESLLTTYLGRDVALRVLAGAVERGVAEPLEAVIWASDLQGFTRLADTEPRARLIDLLNAYTDVTVAAIEAAGGEVSKFMGDGILATFPAAAPGAALDAATTALAATRALTAERAAAGLPVTALRLALHRGEVFYGNVGSASRLDFTVIGPAVNEAARLCDMARALDQGLVLSSAFHDATSDADRARLVGVGRYALRGVAKPQALFTLDESG